MNFQPYAVAKYGVYAAVAVAGISVWLGQQAGATLDFSLMRAVFVFVIFTAIGFGAEAVLSVGVDANAHESSSTEPGGGSVDD